MIPGLSLDSLQSWVAVEGKRGSPKPAGLAFRSIGLSLFTLIEPSVIFIDAPPATNINRCKCGFGHAHGDQVRTGGKRKEREGEWR